MHWQRDFTLLKPWIKANFSGLLGRSNLSGAKKSGERPLGSRLVMPWAEQTLANYLTDRVKQVVRHEVMDKSKSQGKLFSRPRIFNDLLSSQPLCFNLFGEMRHDLSLATAVFNDITSGRVRTVTSVEFEESPGRGDSRYTGDNSAFDVFVTFKPVFPIWLKQVMR